MKTNRYIVIALLLLIFVSSCEDGFLKQDPQTSLSSEQVFEKPASFCLWAVLSMACDSCESERFLHDFRNR